MTAHRHTYTHCLSQLIPTTVNTHTVESQKGSVDTKPAEPKYIESASDWLIHECFSLSHLSSEHTDLLLFISDLFGLSPFI